MSDPAQPAAAARPTVPQRWKLAPQHPQESALLATQARIPDSLAELLISRGIYTPESAFEFLNPSIDYLHDPLLMLGMSRAVARLEDAIAQHESILLYGDYDVDGTTAVVLLKTAIEMAAGPDGAIVDFHVPHRLKEGYGLQSSVLEEKALTGVRLVITVDTGMRAFAEADTARRLGLDLIITDHHLPEAGDAIPDALAILNPNQPGCSYPEKSLCGAAIAFKLAQALLERKDKARTRGKILPSFLKMVAIATVADAVPLRGENRVLAAAGIRELRKPAGAGLRALMAIAKLDPTSKEITSYDLGFRLGPRINAAGRMDIAAEVVELFTTRDTARAGQLAAKLEQLNLDRRETEAQALRQIEYRLATEPELTANKMLVIAGDGWHRGVIGILASRVVERTAKPTIVISVEDGMAHGSGRSVDGFQLLDALESCADLFSRFGGHAFAVGFALPADRIPLLQQRLYDYANRKLAHRAEEQVISVHAALAPDRVTPVLAGWLKKLEPIGHGNPEPVFLGRNLRLTAPVRIMKERHIRLEVVPADTKGLARSIQMVGWGLAARAAELALAPGSLVDVVYKVRENDHPQYGGLQLEISGIAPAGEQLSETA